MNPKKLVIAAAELFDWLSAAGWIPTLLMRVFVGYFFMETGWGKNIMYEQRRLLWTTKLAGCCYSQYSALRQSLSRIGRCGQRIATMTIDSHGYGAPLRQLLARVFIGPDLVYTSTDGGEASKINEDSANHRFANRQTNRDFASRLGRHGTGDSTRKICEASFHAFTRELSRPSKQFNHSEVGKMSKIAVLLFGALSIVASSCAYHSDDNDFHHAWNPERGWYFGEDHRVAAGCEDKKITRSNLQAPASQTHEQRSRSGQDRIRG